jgi:hypothetical protein
MIHGVPDAALTSGAALPYVRSVGQQGGKMKYRILAWFTAITLLSLLATPVRMAAATSNGRQPIIITFDVPGAAGTCASSINPAGVITGSYVDASGASHGFLRAAGGTITSFDAPGAGTGASQGTGAFSINPAEVITGLTSTRAGRFTASCGNKVLLAERQVSGGHRLKGRDYRVRDHNHFDPNRGLKSNVQFRVRP